ncbi:preprotein translocase subunit YajC [uncultured Flavonifractor sp.]|uniref:preprotein translocase subunit YajC n=1 Tax=uncultured Flavonifractor sp. TaxID=1193534 RepID=UPI0026022DBA|nr:preprotein translocase subunit YajC [uncultured Flavonifractor sp.]
MTAQVANAMLSSTTSVDTTSSLMGMLIPIVLLVAVFYFLLIRPENKKKKAAAKMRSELAVGDQITTIGGIVGTICAVKENTIVIETSSDRVRMEFTKWAVSTRGTQTTEEGPGETKDAKDKK